MDEAKNTLNLKPCAKTERTVQDHGHKNPVASPPAPQPSQPQPPFHTYGMISTNSTSAVFFVPCDCFSAGSRMISGTLTPVSQFVNFCHCPVNTAQPHQFA